MSERALLEELVDLILEEGSANDEWIYNIVDKAQTIRQQLAQPIHDCETCKFNTHIIYPCTQCVHFKKYTEKWQPKAEGSK